MMMKQITTITETEDFLKNLKDQGVKTGFVPTMGALHEGHLSLIRRSRLENGYTVCSIFVNPLQFNNKIDLEKYPRNIVRDLQLLEDSGCDLVFTPETEDMYPESQSVGLDIELGMLGMVMEGKFRPGHFKGVAMVVRKLFEIVQPTCAYFGKKDYQQLTIIKNLVKILELPVEIIPCETVRDPDGLAMSSRNLRLTLSERKLAPKLYQVLRKVKEQKGIVPVGDLKEWAINRIQDDKEFRVEYFEIGDKDTLLPMENWNNINRAVAFVAAFLGEVRLIDNLELFS